MLTCDLKPHGNAAGIFFDGEAKDPVFSFTPAPHGGLDRMWFRFRIINDGIRRKKIHLRLRNFTTMLGIWQGSFLPVIRFSGESFQRLPAGKVLERGDSYRSLEWEIALPENWDFLEAAFSYPYDESDLEDLLRETGNFWRKDEIGTTSEGRLLFRLSNTYGSPDQKQAGLYLIARQHVNETPGAWVLDGVLRQLAANRIDFPVWVIPNADPDGEFNGNYGKNSFPRDLNRSWGPGEAMRHEIKTIQRDMEIWERRILPEKSIAFDFHGPWGDVEDIMCYCSGSQSDSSAEKLRKLGSALGNMASNPFLHGEEAPILSSAWGDGWTFRKFASERMGLLAGVLETSFYRAGGTVLKKEDYRRIGGIWADWAASIVSGRL